MKIGDNKMTIIPLNIVKEDTEMSIILTSNKDLTVKEAMALIKYAHEKYSIANQEDAFEGNYLQKLMDFVCKHYISGTWYEIDDTLDLD